MNTTKSFPHAGFLSQLESLGGSAWSDARMSLSPRLMRALTTMDESGHAATASLIQLLQARQAVWQASLESSMVADELRRYQKFARPGQPSPHIVQLRQQQATVRRASSHAKQSYIATAAAFVRDAGIVVPARTALEVFITVWIDTNVPTEFVVAAD